MKRIISGGQTGADRGGLEAGISLGLEIGGFCPKGRKAEDGVVPRRYPLEELESAEYPARTRKNVEAADATLIFTIGPADRGTALTLQLAKEMNKPLLQVDLALMSEERAAAEIRAWIDNNRPNILNVAGSRESSSPGLQIKSERILIAALERRDH